MGRTADTSDSKLASKTARAKLHAHARNIYFTSIEPRLALGYARRPGSGAGHWYARREVGRSDTGTPKRKISRIAVADDIAAPDGVNVLTYEQARRAAANGELTSSVGPITVEQAVRKYADGRESQKYAASDRDRILARLPADLRVTAVVALTKSEIETWRNGLVLQKGTAEDIRRSKDTANRLLNILKAALNHAFEDDKNRIPSDNAWRKVKAFKNAGASRRDHFTQPQALALIDAAREADAAFADLLEAAFHTGARPPGELAVLNVHHFDPDLAQIKVPEGKTGTRDTTLTKEGVAFFKRLAADKKGRDALLPRADGERWGKNHHQKPIIKALAAAGLPDSATIYTMRHTYISLAGMRGMPIQAVAKNVGTSVKMIEKHYGKFFSEDFRNLVQKHAPALRVVQKAA
jgi:site-specific recombinase XerD